MRLLKKKKKFKICWPCCFEFNQCLTSSSSLVQTMWIWNKMQKIENLFSVEQKNYSPICSLGVLSLRRLQCHYSSKHHWHVHLAHGSGDLHTLNIQQWISTVLLPHSHHVLGHLLSSCGAWKAQKPQRNGRIDPESITVGADHSFL